MALKTEQEIEQDFYLLVRESSLGKAVRGDVYRAWMRPSASRSEGVIVKMLAGNNAQIQTGIVTLSVYVPDIDYDNRKVADYARIAELQPLVNQFISSNISTEYRMRPDETPRTEEAAEIEQHFIYARIHFERLSE